MSVVACFFLFLWIITQLTTITDITTTININIATTTTSVV